MRAQLDEGLRAYDLAAVHAERAGVLARLVGYRSSMRFHGSTPVTELLTWMGEQGETGTRNANFRASRANALAMLGRFDDARAILAQARAELADRGGGIWLGALTGQTSLEVELLAGDPAAAAAFGDAGCRILEELGERSMLSTLAGLRAQALFALGRLEEADASAGQGAALGASDDAYTQMLWRQVRAKVLASRAELAEAERLAREAVAIGDETSMLEAQASAHADLAEVLVAAGADVDAAVELEQALMRHERKGNLVMAERTRSRVAELRNEAPTRAAQRPLGLPGDGDFLPR
jgi:tetratricopeptide (TPR) repeat protein